ncbi:TenA family protein [Brevibacterium salitolerans]|uniref:Thiaminase II n=1 Tax=Brevibacterium salitolerans TaxID=1403566 RepID=A0ABN2X834_9MICO
MRTYHCGPHSLRVWDSVAGTLREIEELEFLTRMLDGSLEPRRFVNYILQDGIYLQGYARAMSLLAAKAGSREESRFWNSSAAGAIADEEAMQADLLADARFAGLAVELAVGSDSGSAAPGALAMGGSTGPATDGVAAPSPTTLGYTSYLVAAAATEPYEVGVAAILPCFWIYAHMGKVLTARAAAGDSGGDASAALAGNPYEAWIRAYDSEEFDRAAEEAVAVYERLAAGATERIRAQMEEAFRRAAVYELHFWQRAGALEDWSV